MKVRHSVAAFKQKKTKAELENEKFEQACGPLLNALKQKVRAFENGEVIPINKRNAKDGTVFETFVKQGNMFFLEGILAAANREQKIALCNEPNYTASTPLFSAVMSGRLHVVKLLVENNARVNWINERNGTPIQLAVEQEKVDVLK
jgi:ankyrin repeat protein